MALPKPAEKAPAPPGEFDICGIGRVKGQPVDTGSWPAEVAASAAGLSLPPDAVVQAGAAQLWARTAQQLRSAGDDRRQAAGLLMQFMGDGEWGPRLDGRLDALAALVRLALRSGDGRVVQWALASCRRSAAGMCQGLSARHWVRAEPGNVIAWMQLWQDEPASLDEAMHGMTLATTSDIGHGALATLVEAAIGDETPPHQRMSAVVWAIGIDTSMPIPSGAALVSRACAPAQLADANRRQQCDAIARVMVERGRDLLSVGIGRRLAERVEWPPAELARLQEELKAVQMTLEATLPISLTQPYSCTSVESMRRWMKGLAEEGELGWLRQQKVRLR